MAVRSFERDTNIKLRFVVGHLQKPADQAILDEEQRTYNDFLVLDVKETYENMILKVRIKSKPGSLCHLLCTLYPELLPQDRAD